MVSGGFGLSCWLVYRADWSLVRLVARAKGSLELDGLSAVGLWSWLVSGAVGLWYFWSLVLKCLWS